jgi:hypothetical protein
MGEATGAVTIICGFDVAVAGTEVMDEIGSGVSVSGMGKAVGIDPGTVDVQAARMHMRIREVRSLRDIWFFFLALLGWQLNIHLEL